MSLKFLKNINFFYFFQGERLGKIKIYAGDIVQNKKPAPDVYLLAAKELSVDPDRCWVVEDSEVRTY